jgi:hypothetical protein
MKNKAQFGGLQAIIIALVVVGIILGIGLLILEEFKDTQNDLIGSVANETMISMNSVTPQYVKYNSTTAGMNCYNNFAMTARNVTTPYALITTSNYTIDSTTGKITVSQDSRFNNSDWNVTYTYTYGTEGCGGIDSTINATNKIPQWLAIVVILAIVGILLAIVFKSLPMGGSGGGGGVFSFKGGSGGTTAEI